MDSLSEESKLLYHMIMSETDEIYEAKFASYRARALAAAATATSKTRSTTTLGASREYCHAMSKQVRATSSPTSAQAISTIRSTAASTCAAAHTRVPAAASLDSSAPTTCSAECPGHDASVYAAAAVALIPSTAPNSFATTGDLVLEVAASVVCDETLPVDASWVAALHGHHVRPIARTVYFVDVLLCFRLEGQPNACAVMLQTYKFYSTRLNSWKDEGGWLGTGQKRRLRPRLGCRPVACACVACSPPPSSRSSPYSL